MRLPEIWAGPEMDKDTGSPEEAEGDTVNEGSPKVRLDIEGKVIDWLDGNLMVIGEAVSLVEEQKLL